MVVIGKFVHGPVESTHVKASHMMLHCSDKSITVTVKILSVLIAVLFHSCKEPGYRLHERIIVHDSIPLITKKPALRISVMLSQNHGLRIRFPYCFAEFFPEMMVKLIAVPQICCHIQSPPIHIIRRRNPFFPTSRIVLQSASDSS